MSPVNAIAFDLYTHGYYCVAERVGEAFKAGLSECPKGQSLFQYCIHPFGAAECDGRAVLPLPLQT